MTAAADDGALLTGVQVARPTILLAGTERSSLAEGLLRLRIDERTDGLCSCEATFGNWGTRGAETGFLYFDRRLLDFGKELAVRLGTETLFGGRVSGLEAAYPDGTPPTLTVLAEDRLQDLRMTRRSRTFTDTTDAALFRTIAAEHGLLADVDLPGPRHAVVAQLNQSDLAFLRERARAVDAELRVDGRRLTVRPRSGRRDASVRLTYRAELREFCVLADLAGQCTSLEVGGWDVAAKAALGERVDDAAVSGELQGGQSGSGVLAAAFGERRDTVVRSVPATGAEAKAKAEALYRQRARRFVSGRGVANPTPGLRAGASVTLGGLGPLFDGRFHVTEVTHLFGGGLGFRTEFAVERAGLGRQP
jgi:phage protein D